VWWAAVGVSPGGPGSHRGLISGLITRNTEDTANGMAGGKLLPNMGAGRVAPGAGLPEGRGFGPEDPKHRKAHYERALAIGEKPFGPDHPGGQVGLRTAGP